MLVDRRVLAPSFSGALLFLLVGPMASPTALAIDAMPQKVVDMPGDPTPGLRCMQADAPAPRARLDVEALLVRDTVEPGTPRPGNMFVPIDTTKPILAELMDKGRCNAPPLPWIGLATEEAQGRLFVVRVSPEGPAEKAGLRPGGIVMGVGADSVSTQADFYRRMWALDRRGPR